jgi:hypothetical protein
MKKSLIAIVMTAVMLLSMVIPLISISSVKAATDPSDWYKTVNGVLDSDYYSLYPFEKDASLKIGFSKYGELINSDANVGLEYGAVDPFAPPAGSGLTQYVPKRDWLQGWFINITYYHRIQGWRNVWAMALLSDSIEYGNDWIRVDFVNDRSTAYGIEDPKDPGYLIYGTGTYGATLVNGGRKTNGTAVTPAIKVLYDGPREFIAECRTTLYDHLISSSVSNSTASDVGLVQVCITIVFDKVKKEVNLLKDIKSILIQKEGDSMKIQFSNRGEVDLGTDATGYGSYAHFYTEGTASWRGVGLNDTSVEGMDTVYDSSWELIQTEDPKNTAFPKYSAAGPYPQDYAATFDVAQAINERAGYVWYAAFWPSLSDWTIDGWDQWWQSLMAYDPHYIDYRDGSAGVEPFIPFYIGEWDFVLYHTLDNLKRTQFRGVTEYGVTYDHDAYDADMGPGYPNQIDREVWYYLDQTFNPWDLLDAVHKDTNRWVEFYTVTADDVYYANFGYPLYIPLERTPVLLDPIWESYAGFTERVLWGGKLKIPYRSVYTAWQYELLVDDATGQGYIYIPATLVPALGTNIKILYSTDTYWERTDDVGPFTFSDSYSMGEAGDTAYLYGYDYETWTDPLDVTHTAGVDDLSSTITLLNAASDWKATISPDDICGWAQNFKVFKDSTYTGSWDFEDMVYANENVSILFNLLDIHWMISAPFGLDVHVWDLGFGVDMDLVFSYNATENELNVTATVSLESPYPYVGFDVLYDETTPGRYEWIEVGRDSKTVDSAGAALVSAAFKNKQIEIGIAGQDMDALTWQNSMPWVMSKFGAGTSAADYKDSIGRAALKDDWCTYWPVASSNMIGVGGPFANVLAYYANDFTNAFFGYPDYSGTDYSMKLTGIPCWNRNWDGLGYNVYSSNETLGYAIISTTLDINGTVLFMVYGYYGRDTYYATNWLHGDVARGIPAGIQQLQQAPMGLTSIILQINYPTLDPTHPTFHVVECLGTKSEILWYHSGEWKGGIHDP